VSTAPVWPINFAIEPLLAADAGRLADALSLMASGEIRFGYSKDPEASELIVKVVDERHIGALVDILKRTHNVEVRVSTPQVAYRETLARSTEVDYTHMKQTGSTGQFARVKLRLEPNAAGAGNVFESEIVGGVVPTEYIPGVEKGVQKLWDSGVLAGFPMVDTKVTLFDGAYHEVDSNSITFASAAHAAMRKGAIKAGVKLVEPIMDVEVTSPDDLVDSVIGDLSSRGGQIRSREMLGNVAVVRAYVPVARLFGYKGDLSSMTKGLGNYAIRFNHYAEVSGGDGPDDFRPAVGMRA
jgi:elongation factor G